MAKVGEGDERWIVKEREDGANVNGWHWSEKNLTEWAKERLTELLCDIVVLDDSTGSCKVCKMEKCTGDVTVQARKQKKFPLYELEITLNWEGQLFDAEVLRPAVCMPCAACWCPPVTCDSDGTAAWRAQGKSKVDAKGKVKIPDLSEETYDDLEMTVTVEEESDAKRALKEAVRLKGAPLIRNACMAFVKELKVPASPAPCPSARTPGGGAAPPTPAAPPLRRVPRHHRATTAPPAAAPPCPPPFSRARSLHARHAAHSSAPLAVTCAVQASVGEGKEMTAKRPPAAERANNTYVTSSAEKSKTSQVKISYDFVPPPQVLYETLLDTNRIKGCTASDASMSRELGGKFSMFSGAVDGENVELRPFSEAAGDALIKWKWRFSTWQPGHYSEVTITLTDKDGSTKLELLQTGVPEEERERTEKGWKGMLLDRMKAMLGGSVMG